MADIRDEHGNPIQLTDEHGNPVQLTDEFGKPMHLTGVATTTTVGSGEYVGPTTHAATPTAGYAGSTTTGTTTHHATPTDYAKRGAGAVAGAGGATLGAVTGIGVAAKDAVTGHTPGAGTHTGAEAEHRRTTQQQEEKFERSGSSSSSSSEDDEQGGRRKKKGLTQKIKEKLTGGGKHGEEEGQGQKAHCFPTKNSSTVAAAPGKPHDPETIHVEHHEHEKKGMMEKIKEKLPGHHH